MLVRVISALVLLPIVVGVIWFTPPIGTWILGAVVLMLAFFEYAALARQLSPAMPTAAAAAATITVYAAIAVEVPVEHVLVATTIAIGLLVVARGRPEEDVLRNAAVAAFPLLYLGAGLGMSLVVREVWGGRANLVELDVAGSAGRIQALSLRLYNPESRQWSLNFSNIRGGTMSPPTIGEFNNGRGEFYSQETLNGRAILVRFVISDITSDSCRFEQAFSADGGKTWETNWIAVDTKVERAAGGTR